MRIFGNFGELMMTAFMTSQMILGNVMLNFKLILFSNSFTKD